jgi:hypothetical protein
MNLISTKQDMNELLYVLNQVLIYNIKGNKLISSSLLSLYLNINDHHNFIENDKINVDQLIDLLELYSLEL